MTTSPDDDTTTDDLSARPAKWLTGHAVHRLFLVLAVRYNLDTDDDTTKEALMNASEAIATRMHEILDALAEVDE